MSARRWMDWQPRISEDVSRSELPKPTKPSFGSFVSAPPAESPKIEAGELSPPRAVITLKNGPTLPVEAIELALDLERREIPLAVDANHQFVVPNDPRLTDADYRAINRWRLHLGAIVEYRAPEIG